MAKHVDHLLTAYIHGELDAAGRSKVEEHLSHCRACCDEHKRLRQLISSLGCLKVEPAPEQWKKICDGSTRSRSSIPAWSLAFAGFAAAAGAVAFVVLRAPRSSTRMLAEGPAFEVLAVSGLVTVAKNPAIKGAKVRQGETLKTSPGSEAKIEVADIGEVTVAGDSEVQLVSSDPKQHRIRLSKGRLSAKVNAPPRLFVIETPSGDAVDLGCAYTLNVTGEGDTVLNVTTGWVAMERQGPDSVVPAGWTCVTRKKEGVGTPMCGTATAEFKKDLTEWDISRTPTSLERVLKCARSRDGLSLWHLLSRTEGARRAEVFEALAKSHPLPIGVSRKSILELDAEALEAWKQTILIPVGTEHMPSWLRSGTR